MSNQSQLVLQVLNVGDGACTIARNEHHDGLTIIDCGTTTPNISGRPEVAVQQTLGLNLARLQTMVVTHFDADHWHGFRDLAPIYKSATVASNAPAALPSLVYAGMPEPVRNLIPAIHALQALAAGRPVGPLNLREAWAKEGIRLQTSFLFRGDSFQSSGLDWKVLWPPRHLPKSVSSWIQNSIEDVKKLAEDMVAEGDHSLQNNLQEAYELWPGPKPRQDGDELLREDDLPIEDVWDSSDKTLQSDIESELDDSGPSPYGELSKKHAESFRARFDEISKKLSAANNYLSLVITQEKNFISFGDIMKNALTALLRLESQKNPTESNHYCVSLAPHHGSHTIPVRARKDFPRACICVSQSGKRLIDKSGNHFTPNSSKTSHNACNHVYTHKEGTITIYPHCSPQCCSISNLSLTNNFAILTCGFYPYKTASRVVNGMLTAPY